ncbi:hypothetical protein DQ241_05960 [Blastococcus sp. TF02A-30]|nr:hypothetical protein DQ241_05960 [Blastococcus sp. TF02A-30]
MSTTHHTHEPSSRLRDRVRTQADRQARCLRHHVWMAACDDCRDARRPRTDDRSETLRAAG